MMNDSSAIRPARPDEADRLTALTLRSKAYWGYDEAFMNAVRANLTIQPAYVATHPVYLIQTADNELAGYYSLRQHMTQTVELDFLFVEPAYIGDGGRYGQRLWQHALATARAAGYAKMLIEAEPRAEGFYLKMGAIRVGYASSPVASLVAPGRQLPMLEYLL